MCDAAERMKHRIMPENVSPILENVVNYHIDSFCLKTSIYCYIVNAQWYCQNNEFYPRLNLIIGVLLL